MPVYTESQFVPPAEGLRDQYADGKAAKVWELFIGDTNTRAGNYKKFLLDIFRSKGCKRILDVACGTGVDSIMLLEEGFEVVSADGSDMMLKYALQERWNRRKEPAFDNWVIEQANWLTLCDDLKDHIKDGFDAVICLGNSFSHLMDRTEDQQVHQQAFRNFQRCLKPGGVLLIDHRNYDTIIEGRESSSGDNIYYDDSHYSDIKTSVLFQSGKPVMITRDYKVKGTKDKSPTEFQFTFYPHQLKKFSKVLEEVFGEKSQHKVLGDFKDLGVVQNPIYYVHIIDKV